MEIDVANLWPNRLIGDQQMPDDGVKDGKWPEWLLKNEKRTSGRYTFTNFNPYKKESAIIKIRAYRAGYYSAIGILISGFIIKNTYQ